MRIRELEIYSKSPQRLRAFYEETLGLNCAFEHETLEVSCGESVLKFGLTESTPVYHFAFNIPENQMSQAIEWLEERVGIIPGLQGEVPVDFRNWNSHAVYFEDPDGNILELIARHDLDNSSSEPFSSSSILNISEIAICGAPIKQSFDEAAKHLGISKYSGDFESFCAAGDEEGLFIMVPTGRNWYPTKIKSEPSRFQALLSNNEHSTRLICTGTSLLFNS